MATASPAPLTSYGTAHTAAAPAMYSQSGPGQWVMHQSPQLVVGQQRFPVAQYQEQQQRVSSGSEAGPAGSSSPSASSQRISGLMTGIRHGLTMHPPLEASAQTQVQSASQHQLQQQMTTLQLWHAMMNQGAMPWFPPFPMLALAQHHAYQATLQHPQGQQLEPVGQTAQQPSTTEVAVMQQAPPHLTPLQDSSVRQTPCPLPTGAAVGVDGGAVDPPTQGAVHAGGGPVCRELDSSTICGVTCTEEE